MDQSAELLAAFKEIETNRGIDRESLFEAIEASLFTACRKNYGYSHNIKVHMDRETGKIQVFSQKNVVEEVADPGQEINLEEARDINPLYNIGDVADVVITPRNFGRISAQSAKQVIMQKIREAERNTLYKEYKDKERRVTTGIVQRFERRSVIISLGKIEAVLPPGEQVPGERYNFGDRVKVFVLEVKDTPKGTSANVSRTHPDFVRALFEAEIPEVADETVEIKSISREAGSRTKIAVYSNNPYVEAVGACVGQNGYRVTRIADELNGEKIDIIKWSPEPRQFISAALNPSRTLAVVIEGERSAKIVVPDHQLSLAIGKEGQNARLAAKLTGYKIDIKSDSAARETGFVDEEDYFKEGEPESFALPVIEEENIPAQEEFRDEEAEVEVISGEADAEEAPAGAAEIEKAYEEFYAEEYDEEFEELYAEEYDEDYYDEEYVYDEGEVV